MCRPPTAAGTLLVLAMLLLLGSGLPSLTPVARATGTGTTELVSIDTSGGIGDNHSQYPAISATGRFVTFHSMASDLVSGDTLGHRDVFVYDRDPDSGTPAMVRVQKSGTQPNGESAYPDISDDGRYIAFHSIANNLLDVTDSNSQWDIFRYDRTTGTIIRASAKSDGTQANGASYYPSISDDGTLIAYESAARNLVSGDSDYYYDIYLYTSSSGTIEWITQGISGQPKNGHAMAAAISGDGRYIAFLSSSNNLVSGDNNSTNTLDLFIYDRLDSDPRNHVVRVGEVATYYGGDAADIRPSISEDGDRIAFRALSTLVQTDTNSLYDVYLYDRTASPAVSLLTLAPNGTTLANNHSGLAVISPEGDYVAFASEASNLVATDSNGYTGDVFIRDLAQSTTELASLSPSGSQGNNISRRPAIGNNGSWVAFDSNASDLTPSGITDNNNKADVFVRDRRSDWTKPTGTIDSPKAGDTYGQATVNFAATASDNSGGSGVKEVRFYVEYGGTRYSAGADTSSPYNTTWATPKTLTTQAITFTIEVEDNLGNVARNASTVATNYIATVLNPNINSSWEPAGAYVNQRALDSTNGDIMCNGASAAMMMGLTGYIEPTFAEMDELATEVFNETDEEGFATDAIAIEVNQYLAGINATETVTYTKPVSYSYSLTNAWDIVTGAIDSGRPIMIGTKLTGDGGHYVVVVGYNESGGGKQIIAYDPYGYSQAQNGTYGTGANSESPGQVKGRWVYYDFTDTNVFDPSDRWLLRFTTP